MKKALLIITLLLCLALTAQAATVVTLNSTNGVVWANSYSLFSAVTATGTGTPVQFKLGAFSLVPMSKHMCTATWAVPLPTSIAFTVDCSEDGTRFGECASVTMTASPTVIHIDKPGIISLRGNYSVRTGGTATTSFSLTCTTGGL